MISIQEVATGQVLLNNAPYAPDLGHSVVLRGDDGDAATWRVTGIMHLPESGSMLVFVVRQACAPPPDGKWSEDGVIEDIEAHIVNRTVLAHMQMFTDVALGSANSLRVRSRALAALSAAVGWVGDAVGSAPGPTQAKQ